MSFLLETTLNIPRPMPRPFILVNILAKPKISLLSRKGTDGEARIFFCLTPYHFI